MQSLTPPDRLARDLHQQYTFSDQRQLVGVTSNIGSTISQDFVYSYTANTPLISGYSAAGTNFAVAKTYEDHRDLLSMIQTTWSGAPVAQFDYTYNNLYQRDTAKTSGSAYVDYYPSTYAGIFYTYKYDGRGELQSAALYGGNTPTTSPTTPELPGRHFEYRYDSAGNRLLAGEAGGQGSADDQFWPNSLNQYTSRENNVVRVIGTALSSAKVAVAGAPLTGKVDRAWGADVVPPNSTTAVSGAAKVYSGQPGLGSGGADLIGSINKDYFIPKASQGMQYDFDGNLTDDTIWSYAYDAENRLIDVEHQSSLITGGALAAGKARRLTFAYDFLGRRIEKKVYGWSTGTSSYSTLISDTKFLYDGWNVIAEIDATTGNLSRSYSWGLDLTGSLTGSGGVGALLQMYDYAGATYWPAYDGNGNVAVLLNASSGSPAVTYEYDPFGGLLRNEIASSDTILPVRPNPFRFSTKYWDDDSGLVYYGNRYFSPSLGRFINRDPSGEAGGANLYAFCNNDAINGWDMLGLYLLDGNGWLPGIVHLPPYIINDFYDPDDDDDGGGGGLIGVSGSPTSGHPAPAHKDAPAQPPPTDPTKKDKGNKKWEPNKKNCDALREKYATYINAKDQETEFVHLIDAINAAAVQMALGKYQYYFEYQSFVVRYDGYFMIVSPYTDHDFNQVSSSMAFQLSNAYGGWRSVAASMHSHPPFLDDHLTNEQFSFNDQVITGQRLGVLLTPDYNLRTYSTQKDPPANQVTEGGYLGNILKDAVPSEDLANLQQCAKAGF